MDTPVEAVLPENPSALATLISEAVAKLAGLPMAASTEDELLVVADTMEQARRRLDGAEATVMVEISDRGAYRKTGAFTLHQFLAQHLRAGSGAASRRLAAITAIGSFSSMTGGTLDPALPATAAAVADGAIGGDHVREIDAVMVQIPAAVDADTRARAEAQLATVARDLTPDGVRFAGNRLLAHLDPDGQVTDEKDRARTRGFTLQPQDRRLMSKVRALLTPQLRATLEVVLPQWAAPGMNNPDDPQSPRGCCSVAEPAALAAAAERDERTQSQRNHDALLAILEAAQASVVGGARPGGGAPGPGPVGGGGSGSLASELVITVTDRELAAHAGLALTATGTRVPVQDLVRVAANAQQHLAVFSHVTGKPLYFGRGRRLATKAQRLMLFARDRGCSAPECAAPFARTQAHHLTEWQDGGLTDIDNLGAACGRHNRAVGHRVGDWETRIVIDGPHAGRVGWRPVAMGPRASWRVNQLHHAELLADQGPHGPPDPAGSRVEAHLTRLLTA